MKPNLRYLAEYDEIDLHNTLAHMALRQGDSQAVRHHRRLAGKVWLRLSRMAIASKEVHAYRLLAAAEHFRCGDYQKAATILRRVEMRFVSKRFHGLIRDIARGCKPTKSFPGLPHPVAIAPTPAA